LRKILLSIKPEYVKKIMDGSKKYEYRKHLTTQPIDLIIIYSTSPESKIIGEVKVVGTISASPTALWEKTKKNAGISRKKYREYFQRSKIAYAYVLGDAEMYEISKNLSDYGLKQAPQSFVYLPD
jgi:predicted transcriptional regulator